MPPNKSNIAQEGQVYHIHGFVCPECMHAFENGDQLTSHFTIAHEQPSPTNPVVSAIEPPSIAALANEREREKEREKERAIKNKVATYPPFSPYNE